MALNRFKKHWDIFLVVIVMAILAALFGTIFNRPKIIIPPVTVVKTDSIQKEITLTKEDIIIQKARDTIFIEKLKLIKHEKDSIISYTNYGDIITQYILLTNNITRYSTSKDSTR